MADYYPMIAKAVNGLEKSTGEARRALYDRARTALLAQLRGVEPPLAEPDITRERLSLEEAIRKVEVEARGGPRNARPRRAEPRAAPSRPSGIPEETRDRGQRYLVIGEMAGLVVGALIFVGSYIYCIVTYGFLWGLGFGWLPSAISAVIVKEVVTFLWAPILAVAILAALYWMNATEFAHEFGAQAQAPSDLGATIGIGLLVLFIASVVMAFVRFRG
jgi:hypothetical protein